MIILASWKYIPEQSMTLIEPVFKVYLHQMLLNIYNFLKVRLLPSDKICIICFIESPLKMVKNAFYFILKMLLSWLFGQAENLAWLEK